LPHHRHRDLSSIEQVEWAILGYILTKGILPGRIEEALAAGIDDYLMKDCQRQELIQTIKTLSERPDTTPLSH